MPPGSLNPGPISDQKCHFSQSFSDLTLKAFMPSFTLRLEQQQRKFFKSISSSHVSLFLYSFGIETINTFIHAPSRFPREPSSGFHPRRPRGGRSGREKRRDESFQAQAEKPLGTVSHRTTFPNGQANAGSCLGPKLFCIIEPIGGKASPEFFS